MTAAFRRVIYEDIWRDLEATKLGDAYTFQNSAIAWRLQPTERELQLLGQHKMGNALAVKLPDHHFTWNEAMAGEFVPYVTDDLDEQLEVQGEVTAAASKWTIFFQTMM